MIFSNCPRCSSNKIRRGYQRTPWWSAVIGRYNLHCVKCNWEFLGFAVPGTVSHKIAERKKKTPRDDARQHTPLPENTFLETTSNEVAESEELSQTQTLEIKSDDSQILSEPEAVELTNVAQDDETVVDSVVEKPKRRRTKKRTRVKLQK